MLRNGLLQKFKSTVTKWMDCNELDYAYLTISSEKMLTFYYRAFKSNLKYVGNIQNVFDHFEF